MAAKQYDAVVIGGGHNGLINAAYLARAGLRTAVLEQRHAVGGATFTAELIPGFRFSMFSYLVSLLRPQIIHDLQLARHGLLFLPFQSTFSPTADHYLLRGPDKWQNYHAIARFSRRDAEAYLEWGQRTSRLAHAVKPLIDVIPPTLGSDDPAERERLRALGRYLHSLGPDTLYQLTRLLTGSAAELIEEQFESEPLKGTLAASGIIGTFLGPRSPGSAYVLLHHYFGEIDGNYREWAFVKGGNGGLAEVLRRAAEAHGVEVRVNSGVREVIVENGTAKGVVLHNGETIYAERVISALDPRQTFLRLVDPYWLPAALVEGVRRYKFQGAAAKVNLALSGLPEFTARPNRDAHGRLQIDHLRGAISISPSLDYLERAYDAAKHGDFSPRPYLDCGIISLVDPDLAPPGSHIMTCFVMYAPYHLREGTWDDKREALGDAVVETLAEYAPNIKELILYRQVLTPLDIERTIGLSEGNIFAGELFASQLFFFRPVPGWNQYTTPIRNYYQAGSGTHPGGAVSGGPGMLAARRILELIQQEV